jgi:hypothetical protein
MAASRWEHFWRRILNDESVEVDDLMPSTSGLINFLKLKGMMSKRTSCAKISGVWSFLRRMEEPLAVSVQGILHFGISLLPIGLKKESWVLKQSSLATMSA